MLNVLKENILKFPAKKYRLVLYPLNLNEIFFRHKFIFADEKAAVIAGENYLKYSDAVEYWVEVEVFNDA